MGIFVFQLNLLPPFSLHLQILVRANLPSNSLPIHLTVTLQSTSKQTPSQIAPNSKFYDKNSASGADKYSFNDCKAQHKTNSTFADSAKEEILKLIHVLSVLWDKKFKFQQKNILIDP